MSRVGRCVRIMRDIGHMGNQRPDSPGGICQMERKMVMRMKF